MTTYCILCLSPFNPRTHPGLQEQVCEDHIKCHTHDCREPIYPQEIGGDGDYCAWCLLETATEELKDATLQPMSEDYAPVLKKAGVYVKQAQGIVDAVEAEYAKRLKIAQRRAA